MQQHFTTLTGCEPDAPNECVENYLYNLAERAYREPLSSDDRASLATLLAEVWATDASPSDVAHLGVLAISTAPQFLYRKELGDGAPPWVPSLTTSWRNKCLTHHQRSTG